MSNQVKEGSLADMLGKFETEQGTLPPVKDWNPELSGDMDMIIEPDGQWRHEGDIIKRDKLSRLFSSILKKEGEDYYLVTPVEKWRIKVVDQPFVAVLCKVTQAGITLLTNMGEEITLNSSGQLSIDDHESPKVHVRDNLYARLGRSVFYEIADLAVQDGEGYWIESFGVKLQIA